MTTATEPKKLAPCEVAAIKAALADPSHNKAKLARDFGVSRNAIRQIASGTSYRDVPAGKPIDPEDARYVGLQATIASLQGELQAAKRSAKAASKQHGLFQAIVEELENNIEPLPAPKLLVPKQRKGAIVETLVVHLSDMHADEIVRPEETSGLENYNFQVACRRAENFVQTIVDFSQNTLTTHHFEDLMILSYGDHTSGEIHGAAERSEFRNQFNNSLAVGQLQALMIRDLAPYFNSVNIVCVPGNHGRRSKKKDHHGAKNNWDYLIAKVAQLHLQGVPNLEFIIPDAFSINVDIRGHVFNVSHGDDCRGNAGIPFYSMLRRQGNLMKLAAMNKSAPVRYSVMGHHHVASSLQDLNGEMIVNGAWVGTNAYAFNAFSGYREPTQWIHGVSERHGATWRLPVTLRSDDELNGPQRYKVAI